MTDAADSFQCEIQKVLFRNEENGWCACRASRPGRKGYVFVVGVLPGIAHGDLLTVTGRWETHDRFGKQLKVTSFETHLPDSTRGVVKWLHSRIPSIGTGRARNLVDHFGLPELWTVLEETPERLGEVEGIGEEMAKVVAEIYQRFRSERELMTWLFQLGLTDRLAARVLERWGHNARTDIEENPYQLTQIDGIDFPTADKAALQGLEWPRDSSVRAAAALEYVARTEAYRTGSTWVPLSIVTQRAGFLTGGMDPETLYSGMHTARMVVQGSLVSPAELASAEALIAAFVEDSYIPGAEG